MGFAIPFEPDPADGISLTYEEFLEAIARLEELDFPIERDPEDAWPDFVGWRVNYEQAAYAIAFKIDAVPALWSGPRRREGPTAHPADPAAPRPRERRPESRSRRSTSPDKPKPGPDEPAAG